MRFSSDAFVTMPWSADFFLDVMRRSGEIALITQNEAQKTASFKSDRSIVTKADLQISENFANAFKPYVANGELAIIDEEKGRGQKDLATSLQKAAYVLVIDPLDGTSAYASRLHNYGHMAALFHKGEPVFAASYMPATKQILFGDTQTLYWADAAFTKSEHLTRITPQQRNDANSTMIQGTDSAIRRYPQITPMLNLYDAAHWIPSTITGQLRASYSHKVLKVWDIASAIVFARASGCALNAVSFTEGKPTFKKQITTLDLADYTDCWNIRHNTVLCSLSDTPTLCQKPSRVKQVSLFPDFA